MNTDTDTRSITTARVSARDFHALLAGALTHADKDQTRSRISGVYLWRKGGRIFATATDRFRLIEGNIEGEGEGDSAPIRLAYGDVKALISTLSKEKAGQVEITLAGDLVSVSVRGNTLTLTAYADEYPPYAHLFPEEGQSPIDMPAISLNPSFLADYGKIVGKKGQTIIRQYQSQRPYEITLIGELGGVVWRALLMPMKF
jgi:DNA polymerase III sliding clamp (beta) subunit (PCNA family)